MTTGTYSVLPLIVKVTLLELASAFSLPFEAKTQYFVYISFNSILQLINCISGDPTKLLMYINSTATAMFLLIPIDPSSIVSPAASSFE